MFQASTNDVVIVPESVSYTVRDTWPMHYELHLRVGYQFPSDVTKRTNSEAVIAYFIAHPTYPFWVASTGLEPRSSELLILREDFGVYREPRGRLAELTKDW